MPRKSNTVLLKTVLSMIILVVVLAGCSNNSAAQEKAGIPPAPAGTFSGGPTNGTVQSSTGGGVTIEVEWEGLSGTSLAFSVAMDTHSGSLDEYDLGKLSVLRDSTGKEYRASAWNAPTGGHHRKGVLTFPVEPTALKSAKSVVLTIWDVAGVKVRDFKWQLG